MRERKRGRERALRAHPSPPLLFQVEGCLASITVSNNMRARLCEAHAAPGVVLWATAAGGADGPPRAWGPCAFCQQRGHVTSVENFDIAPEGGFKRCEGGKRGRVACARPRSPFTPPPCSPQQLPPLPEEAQRVAQAPPRVQRRRRRRAPRPARGRVARAAARARRLRRRRQFGRAPLRPVRRRRRLGWRRLPAGRRAHAAPSARGGRARARLAALGVGRR